MRTSVFRRWWNFFKAVLFSRQNSLLHYDGFTPSLVCVKQESRDMGYETSKYATLIHTYLFRTSKYATLIHTYLFRTSKYATLIHKFSVKRFFFREKLSLRRLQAVPGLCLVCVKQKPRDMGYETSEYANLYPQKVVEFFLKRLFFRKKSRGPFCSLAWPAVSDPVSLIGIPYTICFRL